MADKGFGIKELNLIGDAGVPTIESPNNLNLNAVNVAISTNVSVGKALTVNGINGSSQSIVATGIIKAGTHLEAAGRLSVNENIQSNGFAYTQSSNELLVGDESDDSVGTIKVGTGIVAHAGVITATSFVGAATTATYAGSWVLGANGTSDYTFTGTGLTGTVNEATLTLQRGKKYIFKNRSGGHPFRIQTSYQDTSGTLYNSGVTNNGGGDGTDIIFDVPQDAPDALYYQCSSHSGMSGRINIGKYQVQVLARRNGNLTGHNSETTVVLYNYIHTSDSTNDASTYFDTSTGLLTAPVSGMYLINAAARSSNQSYGQAWLRVDNAREQWTDVVFPSSSNFACSTHMVYLNAGQTVGYQPYEAGGTNGQINDDNNHTYFRCVLIG